MALIIDATLGGSSSNSYVTLAESDTYFESRLYVSVWTDATDDLKNRALVMATRRVDYEKFYGDRATPTQSLALPRINLDYLDGIDMNNTIPYQIKHATMELALYMLATDMSKVGINDGAVKKVKVGSIEKEYHYDKSDNVSRSYDELPSFVESLLEDLSKTVSSSGMIGVGR